MSSDAVFVHSGYIWWLYIHNTHTPTVYLRETSDCPTTWHPFDNAEGKLLVFAERAVTTDGRYMFPAELVQGRLRPARKTAAFTCYSACLFCASCVALMWTPQSKAPQIAHPQTWHAQPSCSADVHWAVWRLCYHLLNVCVSPGLFRLMFSDVITCSRLYSEFSHSPWLPPSGRNGESALNPQQHVAGWCFSLVCILNILDFEVKLKLFIP